MPIFYSVNDEFYVGLLIELTILRESVYFLDTLVKKVSNVFSRDG